MKYTTVDPYLTEVKNVLGNLTLPIDGVTYNQLNFFGSVGNIEAIIRGLTLQYGEPTHNNPYASEICWSKIRPDFSIVVIKPTRLDKDNKSVIVVNRY